MTAWIGFLSVRFTIACNVIPEFKDSSDALMKRIILLSFRQSFYGREDIHLEKRLRGELPGILRWAIDGWRRLQQRGHFVQPAAGADQIEDMIDLANPIAGWLRDRCQIDPEGEATCKEAYDDFVAWAEKNREKIMTKKAFGSRLKGAGRVSTLPARDGNQVRAVYRGISLRL